MGELSNSPRKVLPEFQKFLLEGKLVLEKKRFFACLVSKFPDLARKRIL
jgi:hypothetical protein